MISCSAVISRPVKTGETPPKGDGLHRRHPDKPAA
jgi:hypothetical protein